MQLAPGTHLVVGSECCRHTNWCSHYQLRAGDAWARHQITVGQLTRCISYIELLGILQLSCDSNSRPQRLICPWQLQKDVKMLCPLHWLLNMKWGEQVNSMELVVAYFHVLLHNLSGKLTITQRGE
jgi:hypothetical protein